MELSFCSHCICSFLSTGYLKLPMAWFFKPFVHFQLTLLGGPSDKYIMTNQVIPSSVIQTELLILQACFCWGPITYSFNSRFSRTHRYIIFGIIISKSERGDGQEPQRRKPAILRKRSEATSYTKSPKPAKGKGRKRKKCIGHNPSR